jgi:hypothetical protein
MNTRPPWLPDQFCAEFDRLHADAFPTARSEDELALLALNVMVLELWRSAMARCERVMSTDSTPSEFLAAVGFMELMTVCTKHLEQLLKPRGETVQ